MASIRLLFGSVFVLALGCSAATEGPGAPGDGEVPGTRVSTDALAGGCHWDCPKCAQNGPCSMAPCVLSCPPSVKPCGDRACGTGEYCCNASCGICAPEGDFCTQQACAPTGQCTVMALCIQGYVWDGKKCACVPAKGGGKTECTTDADCRLEADYCTGCDCLALSPKEQVPACSGPGVQCFADPCLNHAAACVGGQCVVQ